MIVGYIFGGLVLVFLAVSYWTGRDKPDDGSDVSGWGWHRRDR